MAYQPDPIGIPKSLQELSEYVVRELSRIGNAVGSASIQELSVEPTKKQEFMLVAADGFGWNPGSGKGLYIWFNGKWNAVSTTGIIPPPDPDPDPDPEPDPDPVPVPDPDLTAAGRAVATFHCLSIYWSPQKVVPEPGANLQYKRAVDSVWIDGHPLWYDARNGECRGSIVGLNAGTEYDVRFAAPGDPYEFGLRISTWSETFPEGTVSVDNAGTRTSPLKITEGGTAAAYRVYQAHASGSKFDIPETTLAAIEVRASFVIIRGYEIKGGRHSIWIGPGVHDVLIEDNDIHDWGLFQANFGGIKRGQSYDSALFFRAPHDGVRHPPDPNVQRLIMQRNKIHDPKYGANSWQYGHPHGPHGVTLWETGGNHVFRYNEFYSASEAHYFNDAIGGGENFSNVGAPGPDTDIYQNYVQGFWDDGIECEGGGMNVRIFANYIDGGAAHIATTVVHKGPCYIFRNVVNRSKMRADLSLDNSTSRGRFAKSHTLPAWGGGRRYVYHNTTLQTPAVAPNTIRPLGAGRGISGAVGEPMTNTVSRNNIYNVYVNTEWSVNTQGGAGNDFNYDLYNGKLGSQTGMEPNGIKVDPSGASALPQGPIFKAGHGAEPSGFPLGKYQLNPGSPGHNAGVVVLNFSDGFLGAAPDMGAHEEGTSNMVFGITA